MGMRNGEQPGDDGPGQRNRADDTPEPSDRFGVCERYKDAFLPFHTLGVENYIVIADQRRIVHLINTQLHQFRPASQPPGPGG